MPPKTDRVYGETSFTSIPSELIEAVRGLADRQNVYLYELFAKAISDLNRRIDSGEKIEWPQARKIPRKVYHTRMEIDVLESLKDACEKHAIKKNIFFIAALRDYLLKHGLEVEI
jgi:hypothetical protein